MKIIYINCCRPVSMVKVFQDLLWALCFVASGDWMLTEHSHHHKNDTQAHLWAQSFWYKNVAIPIICLFPLWLRFHQCLRRYLDTGKRVPNLPNAFKYAMSQTVTLFGTFHPLYLMSASEQDSFDVSDDGGELRFIRRTNLFQMFWMCLFVTSSLYSFCWVSCSVGVLNILSYDQKTSSLTVLLFLWCMGLHFDRTCTWTGD
jgi:hypothetical protein